MEKQSEGKPNLGHQEPSSPPSSCSHSSAGHSDKLLSQLNELRKAEQVPTNRPSAPANSGPIPEYFQFTDVVLLSDGSRIAAHRNVLAAASPYFRAMFSGHFPESDQREVHLEGIEAHCLRLAIDFIYTGRLDNVTDECVQHLLQTASFLQLEPLAGVCGQYMAALLDADNCLGFKHFAEKHDNRLLLEAANDFIVTHFQQVVQSEEFADMSFAELAAILSDDKLYVHSDESVLRGLVRWAEHRPTERSGQLAPLLRHIHPACVGPEVARSLPLLQDDPACSDWLGAVLHCERGLRWRIFILDKMGRRQPDMNRYDLPSASLEPLKPPPRPAFALSLAAHKNILYVQGGSAGRAASCRHAFYYNIYRDQWFELAPLLVERSHHRSVVVRDCLYALGGNSLQGATATTECLNLATSRASPCAGMLARRSSMGAVALGDAIYVMGGENDQRSLYTVERLDVRSGRWQELAPMQEVNSYCTSAAVGGDIYCCEGLGSCMERYDVRTNRWQVIDFWQEREFYEIFAVDGALFSTSGEAISRYDAATGRWLTSHKFAEERDWDTAVAMPMLDATI